MNIILIGLDGTGKTTLSLLLHKQLGYRCVHVNNETYKTLGWRAHYGFEANLLKQDQHVVLDRCSIIDRYVYDLNHHRKGATPRQVRLLKRKHNVLVLLENELDTLKQRKPKDDWDWIQRVDYKATLNHWHLPFWVVKTQGSLDDTVAELVHIAQCYDPTLGVQK